jgi:hypothetical protein
MIDVGGRFDVLATLVAVHIRGERQRIEDKVEVLDRIGHHTQLGLLLGKFTAIPIVNEARSD